MPCEGRGTRRARRWLNNHEGKVRRVLYYDAALWQATILYSGLGKAYPFLAVLLHPVSILYNGEVCGRRCWVVACIDVQLPTGGGILGGGLRFRRTGMRPRGCRRPATRSSWGGWCWVWGGGGGLGGGGWGVWWGGGCA